MEDQEPPSDAQHDVRTEEGRIRAIAWISSEPADRRNLSSESLNKLRPAPLPLNAAPRPATCSSYARMAVARRRATMVRESRRAPRQWGCEPPIEAGERQLGRHLAAALGAAAARVDALLHVPDPLAVFGALLADFRAFAAGVLVMRGADEHEMG